MELQKLYDEGIGHLYNAELTEALNIGKNLIEIDDSFAPAWYLLARVALQARDLEKSVELINRAIIEDAENSDYFIFLGYSLLEMGKVDPAKQQALHAMSINEENIQALDLLGTIELYDNNYEESYKYFLMYIERDQANPSVYNNLGLIASIANLQPEAEKYFLKGLELEPNNLDLLNNIASIYISSNDIPAAKKYLQQALANDPKHSDALCNYGIILKSEGDIDAAIDNFAKAIEANPQHINSLCNIGSCFLQKAEPHTAAMFLLNAVNLKPDFFEAKMNLGIALYNMHEYHKGLICFQECYTIESENADCCYYLGVCSLMCHDYQRAIGLLQQAAQLKINNANIIYALGQAYIAGKEWQHASDCFKRVLELNPELKFCDVYLLYLAQKHNTNETSAYQQKINELTNFNFNIQLHIIQELQVSDQIKRGLIASNYNSMIIQRNYTPKMHRVALNQEKIKAAVISADDSLVVGLKNIFPDNYIIQQYTPEYLAQSDPRCNANTFNQENFSIIVADDQPKTLEHYEILALHPSPIQIILCSDQHKYLYDDRIFNTSCSYNLDELPAVCEELLAKQVTVSDEQS